MKRPFQRVLLVGAFGMIGVLGFVVVLVLKRNGSRTRNDRESVVATSAIAVRIRPRALPIGRVLPTITESVSDWRRFKPATITVAVEAVLSLDFHAVRVTEANGVTTWIGRNALPGASLVGIGKRDHWHGVLSLVGASYDIHVRGSVVIVTENKPLDKCATVAAAKTGRLRGAASYLVHESEPTAQAVPITGDPSVHASGTTIYTVDVAFFYTQELEPEAAAIAGSVDAVASYLDSKYRAYIETNNLVLEQSLVPNLRWHFLGIFKAPSYTRLLDHTDPVGTPVYSLAGDLTAIRVTTGNTGTYVDHKITALSADQYVLVVPDPRDAAGEAELGSASVVTFSCGPLTTAHEMGHNFGLLHDRVSDNIPDSDTGYNFGYLFQYDFSRFGGRNSDQGINPNTIGDIMSYGAAQPYYSNPNVFVVGNDFAAGSISLPDNNRYVLGVDAGQPRAAYAARTLWEGSAVMAAHRNPVGEVFPSIAIQPLTAIGTGIGGQIRLSVCATGTNLTYQWRKNGIAIADATAATYTKASATAEDSGSYDLVVTNALGSVITRAAAVTVSIQATASRLANISTRSPVSTGDGVQIAGFVITGDVPKTVLIRANGPALASLGVSGALEDPVVELHDRTSTIANNDDWSSDAAAADEIRSAVSDVGAQPWTTGSHDAAILITLSHGVYSAIVRGKNEATGVALIEVYEVDRAGSSVVNISTRSNVGSEDDVQIAGFVITGEAPKTVLIRANGPALTALGVSGALADPVLELHDRMGTIANNDDWSTDAATADAIRSTALQVGAQPWTTGSRDAAILVTLNRGAYTAIVKGKDGAAGVALIEVYDASPP